MASAKKPRRLKQNPRPEGQLRQSQLITTFGPGAMVDLVDRAVVVGGLEHWGYGRDGAGRVLDDARLRRSLLPRLKALHPDLDLAPSGYFRLPPEGDSRDPSLSVGVRAVEFPRWFVCQGCRRLARAGDHFVPKGERYYHHCTSNRSALAGPVRFVAACRSGHLSDFEWMSFVHLDRRGPRCERSALYLDEGATGDFGKIVVRCETCGSSQPMNRARLIPMSCRGERPWLGGHEANEACTQRLELLVRTGSDAYFAQMVSALRLPDPEPEPLRKRVREKDNWRVLAKATTEAKVALMLEMVEHLPEAFAGYSAAEIAAAVTAELDAEAGLSERPLRSAEFERITTAPIEMPGVVPERDAEFAAYRVPRAKLDLPARVAGLVVVPALREVRVQVSFSRFDSVSANLQGEFDYDKLRIKPAPLTMPGGNEKWLPAAEIRGEGVFVQLDEDAVQEWERSAAVQERAERLLRACEADGRVNFPGVRFYMLHSLAHLVVTAISLECGYAASALRERIYCHPPGDDEAAMAAILISTGTTGSEGTLGGLVEEGRRLRHHLREAWDMGRLCSNDPVCAAHDPSSEGSDRRTEAAACHGCLYIAESSCERFNRFLDRALVVPTIGNPAELAFFQERP
ncbi:DrmB family protein [Haliangium sp.]|uniref:DrmB family protein n=1 Tax=Haliangium sp. TaxID=2663208 RepID=UPI003D1384EA